MTITRRSMTTLRTVSMMGLAITAAIAWTGCGKESPKAPPTLPPPATLPQSPVPPPPAAETPGPGPAAAANATADLARPEAAGSVIARESDYLLQVVRETHPVVTPLNGLTPVPLTQTPVPPGVYALEDAGGLAGIGGRSSFGTRFVMINNSGTVHAAPYVPRADDLGYYSGTPIGSMGVTFRPGSLARPYSCTGSEKQTRVIYTSLRSGAVFTLASSSREIAAIPFSYKVSNDSAIPAGAVFRELYRAPTVITGLARDGAHLCVVMLGSKDAQLAIYALPGGGVIDRVTIQAEGARAAEGKVRVVRAQPKLPAEAEQAKMEDFFGPGPIHLRGRTVEVYGVEMELP